MKKQIIILIHITLIVTSLLAQKQATLYTRDDNGKTYTSLSEALQEPENVYRLKLTKLANRDSLPEELFLLTELRELTVKGCRLCVLNQNIDKLPKLESLNLDKNKLLRLPESIGNLKNLKYLCISRNIIETLPNSISNLSRLTYIDAWDNPLYILPESIKSLQKTLQILDLRQIPLTKSEYKAMQELLPDTEILFTDICECENRRDHN